MIDTTPIHASIYFAAGILLTIIINMVYTESRNWRPSFMQAVLLIGTASGIYNAVEQTVWHGIASFLHIVGTFALVAALLFKAFPNWLDRTANLNQRVDVLEKSVTRLVEDMRDSAFGEDDEEGDGR